MRVRNQYTSGQYLALAISAFVLSACSTLPEPSVSDSASSRSSASPKKSVGKSRLPAAGSGRGGYYLDDGPADNVPEGLLDIPDPEPKVEPYSKAASRPYSVFGTGYTPITDERPFKQRGIGSWYGKKFHGQKTSSGELYDMFKMTAAHPTLPIPSYARVTNLNNGKQVTVRINDRGPFHSDRVIDLSYTAALKLDYLGKGSSLLEVERILPEEIERMASNKSLKDTQPAAPASTPTAVLARTDKVQSAQDGLTAIPATQSDAAAIKPAVFTVNAPASAPAVATLVSAAAAGFYIQLGAYGQSANANAVRARMLTDWPANLPSPEVAEYGSLFRLQSGPFPSRAEAAAAALQLQNAGTYKPMIVQR